MIQFNLLPSVKLDYVKARRNKRMTLLVAFLVAGSTFAVLVILFIAVQLVQKKYSTDLSADIKSESSKLEGTQDLNKILTIQNQLNSLPGLHDKKPDTTRLLNFVKKITPAKVNIANMDVDFAASSITITGAADSISTVNIFVDTIKFTNYKTADNQTGKAFSSVVLSSFSKDEKGVKYSVTFAFDPIIFSSASAVDLEIPPGKITTRSETEKPDELFQPLSEPSGGQQ